VNKAYIPALSIVLGLMGLAFLAAPGTWLGGLGVQVSDPSVMSMIRSTGGLYLGLVAFLLLASRRTDGPGLSILAAVLAMGGLIVGRLVGLVAEGMPTRPILVCGLVELGFGLWGMAALRRTGPGRA